MKRDRPLVGVIADRREVDGHPYHLAGEKYLAALVKASGVYPVILPAIVQDIDVPEILEEFDGLFLTGSQSNVEPHHYMGDPSEPGTWHDPERDRKALALIPAALRAAMPLFAVCRGFQEMNVAFGGSLHQRVHEVSGYQDHREPDVEDLDVMYGPAHEVRFEPGGYLQAITGLDRAEVNSLHHQGVDRLAGELVVEALAGDGLVEAFRVRNAPGFTLGVQWHPEWKVMENPVSLVIFQAFGDACKDYRKDNATLARTGVAG